MSNDTLLTPEDTTVKAIETLRLLFSSQFPHFTSDVLRSLIAKTLSMLLTRMFDGKSLRFPLLGTENCRRHSGHVMLSQSLLCRWISFKHWRQKQCKHGSCFGSVYVFVHTEQRKSSCSFFTSMIFVECMNLTFWVGDRICKCFVFMSSQKIRPITKCCKGWRSASQKTHKNS